MRSNYSPERRIMTRPLMTNPPACKHGFVWTILLCLNMLFFQPMLPVQNAEAATVPQAASAAGREMDRQIIDRLGQSGSVNLSMSTFVDSNNLDNANPLARQMQEEVTRWFVQAGYDVQEIRKGRNVLFEPQVGEKVLTRRERQVDNRTVTSSAIVVGTYTVTPDNVRFNIRVMRTRGRDILAMSTVTVPVTREIATLLVNSTRRGKDGFLSAPIEPTVVTLLP